MNPSRVKPEPFRIYPGSSIIFQPDPSSSVSSSSDDEGSDTSGGTTDPGEKIGALLAAANQRNTLMPSRILKRMSSVTLIEEDARVPQHHVEGRSVTTTTTPASSSASPSSAAGGSESEDKSPPAGGRQRSADEDDDRRFQREESIPLNCMTQERVHFPRKRPAPSPAAGMQGQLNGVEYSWKRPSHQPAPEPSSSHMDVSSSYDDKAAAKSTSLQTPAHIGDNVVMSLPKKVESDTVGTLLVYQPTCLDHHNDTHQENRERLGVLCGPEGVLHKDRFKDLQWANLNELKPARLNDMLRVHSFEYIQHLERVCGLLPEQDEAYSVGRLYDENKDLSYSDWINSEKAKKCYTVTNPPSSGTFDMDAPISKSSYLAARLAAGAVCHAIDKVLTHDAKNAFVVVRPPGHHAGPNGCVEADTFHRRPEMCTCGFCLLNNVAIGAAYALSTYSASYYTSHNGKNASKPIERVAIVDFDIHHGNGTEECIRNLTPHKQNYPLPPSWAPLQFSSYKPWRDEKDQENVLFASIHLYDDDNFYPCSGSGPHGCSPELRDHPNIINMPLDTLGPKYLEERLKLTAKAKKSLMEQASKAFRHNVTTRLLPALTKFHPDLILLSAGFDGHADDFYYFLSEDDYGWITEQIAAVADECCDGRIVSVLEGGYNVVPSKAQKPTTKKNGNNSNFHYAAKLHNREVDEELHTYGSLARSCASHVMALASASKGRGYEPPTPSG
uniref:Histone deacetylase domain-containing protein n=1 Tax=Globisporangium ultimum (strain ATCC 200006 / CBS 805.95 / DAOM BR144) TaxID=431595 RepID=K3WTA3_GLOUD